MHALSGLYGKMDINDLVDGLFDPCDDKIDLR